MPERSVHSVSRSAARFAAVVVRAAAIYVLVGAIAKLLWGAPADLPALLRDNSHGRLGLLFELVVGVELFVAVASLITPRLAWPLVAGLLLVFLMILGVQLSEGAASCGCFGSSITIPPWAMMVADGILVLAIFAVRPWRSLTRQDWRPWALVVASLAAIGGSIFLSLVAEIPEEDIKASDPFVGRAPPIPVDASALNLGVAGETKTPAAKSIAAPVRKRAWRLPEHFPRYVILAPDRWIGKLIGATALATWTDTSKFPADAHLIFYYDTCGHCAEHLRDLADAGLPDSYVLIQLPTTSRNRHPKVVDRMPEGLHVALPSGTRWIIDTPWDVTVKDGRVVAAEFLGE